MSSYWAPQGEIATSIGSNATIQGPPYPITKSEDYTIYSSGGNYYALAAPDSGLGAVTLNSNFAAVFNSCITNLNGANGGLIGVRIRGTVSPTTSMVFKSNVSVRFDPGLVLDFTSSTAKSMDFLGATNVNVFAHGVIFQNPVNAAGSRLLNLGSNQSFLRWYGGKFIGFSGGSNTNYAMFLNAAGLSDCWFYDLEITGCGKAGTPTIFLSISAAATNIFRIWFIHCNIHDNLGAGLLVAGQGLADCTDIWVINSRIFNNGVAINDADGIDFIGLQKGYIVNCTVESNTSIGASVTNTKGAQVLKDVSILGGTFAANGGNGIGLGIGNVGIETNLKAIGTTCKNNNVGNDTPGSSNGIKIGSTYIQVENNRCYDDTPAASTTCNGTSNSGQKVLSVNATAGFLPGYGVAINSAEYNVIDSVQAGTSLTMRRNLTITHSNTETVVQGQTQKYGIYEDITATTGKNTNFNQVVGNDVRGNLTGGVLPASGDSVFEKNKGYNPIGVITNPLGSTITNMFGSTVTNPFQATNQTIGSTGNAANPTTTTVYYANEPVNVTIAAGTGQTITTKDNNGNILDNAAATITNRLLYVGYSVAVTFTVLGITTVKLATIGFGGATATPITGVTYVVNEPIDVTLAAGTTQTINTWDDKGVAIDSAVATLTNRLLKAGYTIQINFAALGVLTVYHATCGFGGSVATMVAGVNYVIVGSPQMITSSGGTSITTYDGTTNAGGNAMDSALATITHYKLEVGQLFVSVGAPTVVSTGD